MNEPVEAGKLICFSEGEYSDYGYVGHFLALEPIGPAEFQAAKDRIRTRLTAAGVWKAYAWDDEAQPVSEMDDSDWRRAYRNEFFAELIRMGKIMDIDCFEFHLGSYGQLDL